MQTKYYFPILIIALIIFLVPLASLAAEEGQFVAGDIFANAITEHQQEAAQEKGSSFSLTIFLSGLMLSVFFVTGAARSYVNLYQRSTAMATKAKAEVEMIIASSAIVHTSQLKKKLAEIDSLDMHIEQLEAQIEMEVGGDEHV